MSYVDKVLEPGEQILARTKTHWIVFAIPAGALGGFMIAWLNAATRHSADADVFGVLSFLSGLVLAVMMVREHFEEHVVTDRRVINKRGVIRRDVAIVPLESIQTVEVAQEMLGRLLDYGTVTVHSASESHGAASRDHIRMPEAWRKQILAAMDGRHTSSSGRTSPASVAAGDVNGRLRKLKELLDEKLISQAEYDEKRRELIGLL